MLVLHRIDSLLTTLKVKAGDSGVLFAQAPITSPLVRPPYSHKKDLSQSRVE